MPVNYLLNLTVRECVACFEVYYLIKIIIHFYGAVGCVFQSGDWVNYFMAIYDDRLKRNNDSTPKPMIAFFGIGLDG